MIKPPALCAAETAHRSNAEPSPGHGCTPIDNPPQQRVWVLRLHPRATFCQSHAVVSIDWSAGLTRTSCGLGLRPSEITDVPIGGCMPCVLCVAATPLPPETLT